MQADLAEQALDARRASGCSVDAIDLRLHKSVGDNDAPVVGVEEEDVGHLLPFVAQRWADPHHVAEHGAAARRASVVCVQFNIAFHWPCVTVELNSFVHAPEQVGTDTVEGVYDSHSGVGELLRDIFEGVHEARPKAGAEPQDHTDLNLLRGL
jgi:hypothetical protein